MNKRQRKKRRKRSQITYKGTMKLWDSLMGVKRTVKPLRWVGKFDGGLVCECGAEVPFGAIHSHDGNSGQMPLNPEMSEYLRGMGTSGHTPTPACP